MCLKSSSSLFCSFFSLSRFLPSPNPTPHPEPRPRTAPLVPDVSPGGCDEPDPGDLRQHRPVGHVDLPTGLHHLQPGLLADLPTHGSRACQRILEDEEEEPEPLKKKMDEKLFS